MQTIQLETKIAAPMERCFLLSLSLDLHKESTSKTREEIIGGRRVGVIGPNERVTWRAKHFGVWLTHETLISKYELPTYFQDVMLKGMFKRFEHDHTFKAQADGGTLMTDVLRFSAPLGLLGWIAETLVLRWYLTRFLVERKALIRNVAESAEGRWTLYLAAS
jgi:ligand-binding SRPBCC domain-containing protein